MNWFRKIADTEQRDVAAATAKLEAARTRRKEAVQRLIEALDSVKIDDGLVKIGDDILKPEKR